MSSSFWARSSAVVVLGVAACSAVGDKAKSPGDPFARLADPEPSVRVAAVAEVGKISDPRAMAALMRAVADPEHGVRVAAANVLAATTDAETLDELITGLDSDDINKHMGSVLALARHADARAFDALMARCEKRNFAFRWQVADAIGDAENRAFIPLMLDRVKQGADWRVQEVAVVALALMHEAVGIDPLLQSIRSDDGYVRRIACWQLGLIGDPRAIDPLIADMLEKYDTYDDRVWGAVAIHRICTRLDPPVAAVVGELAHAQEGKIEELKQVWSGVKDRYLGDESAKP